jgi:hypothetical protein
MFRRPSIHNPFYLSAPELARERVGVRVVHRISTPPHPRPLPLKGRGNSKKSEHCMALLRGGGDDTCATGLCKYGAID